LRAIANDDKHKSLRHLTLIALERIAASVDPLRYCRVRSGVPLDDLACLGEHALQQNRLYDAVMKLNVDTPIGSIVSALEKHAKLLLDLMTSRQLPKVLLEQLGQEFDAIMTVCTDKHAKQRIHEVWKSLVTILPSTTASSSHTGSVQIVNMNLLETTSELHKELMEVNKMNVEQSMERLKELKKNNATVYSSMLPFVKQRSDLWMQIRRDFLVLTASRVGAIFDLGFGENPRKSLIDELTEKKNQASKPTSAMLGGIKDEAGGVQLFLALHPQFKARECGLFLVPGHVLIGASPDRILSLRDGSDQMIVLEVKSRQGRNAPGPATLAYFVQLQIQLLATKAKEGWFFSWNRNTGRYYCQCFDVLDEADAKWLLNEADTFITLIEQAKTKAVQCILPEKKKCDEEMLTRFYNSTLRREYVACGHEPVPAPLALRDLEALRSVLSQLLEALDGSKNIESLVEIRALSEEKLKLRRRSYEHGKKLCDIVEQLVMSNNALSLSLEQITSIGEEIEKYKKATQTTELPLQHAVLAYRNLLTSDQFEQQRLCAFYGVRSALFKFKHYISPSKSNAIEMIRSSIEHAHITSDYNERDRQIASLLSFLDRLAVKSEDVEADLSHLLKVSIEVAAHRLEAFDLVLFSLSLSLSL
jgi:hypothetical protein